MDVRPYDTQNTINTRSRIRLCSFLALMCTMLYIGINQSFTTPHISYLHLFHIFLQPLVLLASLLDWSVLPKTLSFVHLAMLAVDGFVAAMSIISVSRCFAEATATCFDRVYEKGVWTVLASILVILDAMICMQLYLLDSQLAEKDRHEKAEIERLKSTGDAPSWNSLNVMKRKIAVLNIFMLPIDVVYLLCMLYMSNDAPIFYLSIGHVFVDMFLLYIDLGRQQSQFEVFRIVYFALFGLNVLLLIIQLQLDLNEVSKMLALFISVLFLITDINQIVYFSIASDNIQKYNKYKRSL